MTERRRRPGATSAIAKAAQGERLTLRDLVDGIGGPLGIVESVVPTLLFVVLYQVTRDLPLSVTASLGLSALFLAWRLFRRQLVVPAIAGAFGAGISAALALVSGDANNNYIAGIVQNALYGIVFLVSALVRRPILGIAVSFLMNDQRTWRDDPVKFRLYTWLTLLWTAMFALRLLVQVPLYLAGDQVDALGIAKLALGLPLYVPVLVLTVVAVQAVYRRYPS